MGYFEVRGHTGGAGKGVFYLPCQLLFLLWFVLFLPKIRGAGPPDPFPRSPIGIVFHMNIKEDSEMAYWHNWGAAFEEISCLKLKKVIQDCHVLPQFHKLIFSLTHLARFSTRNNLLDQSCTSLAEIMSHNAMKLDACSLWSQLIIILSSWRVPGMILSRGKSISCFFNSKNCTFMFVILDIHATVL